MNQKKLSYLGLFAAVAIIFGYVESLIPFFAGIPGMKLGLANLAVLFILEKYTWKEAALVSIVRIIVIGFMFGNLFSILYSLAPRFDWQSENQPCKQSLSVCVTMFGAYFFAAVIVGVFFAVSALHIPGIAAYAVTTAFLLLLSALMHLLLVHWGAKKFERLEA